MRIVQLANLYAPGSGGLRTAVDALGRGYLAAGHERVLVVPGERFERTESETDGLVVTVPGRPVASGYRVITSLRPVLRLLAELAPDSVEVSDKLTLVKAARWARRTGRRSVLLSHERIDAILAPRVPGWFPLTAAADRWNRRLVRAFDAVVATSAFGAAEFERVGAPGLRRVPLGVDLETFRPAGTVRPEDEPALLVCAGRLSAEKNPRLAVETARVLHQRGVPIRLELVGDGPERERLAELAAGLPVSLTGHLEGRATMAARLAAADVVLAPCPVEAFGLAVLEALACGTPVVAPAGGAVPELLGGGAGLVAPATPEAMATAVQKVLAQPVEQRRARARARAERYPWSASVAGMLRVHEEPAAGH